MSGHIFCRLKAPPPDPTKPFDPMEGDAAVGTLVFLPARGTTRRAATLIACGPGGMWLLGRYVVVREVCGC